MSVWLLAIGAAAIYYAAKHRKRFASTSSRPRAPLSTRSERSGDEGEAAVQAELLSTLRWLCGDDFYLHPGALLLNHAPGTEYPTAEVDHLAITPFGIFIVETKNWSGRIEPGTTEETVVRVGADGRREMRRSPLRQNRSKIAFLRTMLPAIWPVEGIAAFSHPHSEISPALPVELMHAGDLRQWLRSRKASYESSGILPVHVSLARQATLSLCDTTSAAMHRHCEKLRTNPNKLPARN